MRRLLSFGIRMLPGLGPFIGFPDSGGASRTAAAAGIRHGAFMAGAVLNWLALCVMAAPALRARGRANA